MYVYKHVHMLSIHMASVQRWSAVYSVSVHGEISADWSAEETRALVGVGVQANIRNIDIMHYHKLSKAGDSHNIFVGGVIILVNIKMAVLTQSVCIKPVLH